ncbi:site-specific integrase [Halobacteriovorax sp. HLS]|uniref:tyrosine-type recombinase/integrase n=1 Tax=Halobacteriovorax sp. HLS TaxID=2234000 RepID=UPI000FD7A054|nr:site-specific integrase [Halobacteriovorax sp. HLS]
MDMEINSTRSYKNVDLYKLQTDFFSKLKSKGRSSNTLKNYKTDLDCFNHYIKTHNIKLDIANFSIDQVQLYGQFLETKYTSDNSRRRRVQALRIFFDYLVEINLYESNPVRKLPTSPKFLDIPRPTPFIDVKTLWVNLLEEADSKNEMLSLIAKRNQVVMLLIFGSGLKVSDLCKIKVSQIFLDADNPRVLVHHEKRDPYTIPVPEIFKKVYYDYILKLSDMKIKSGVNFDELLFNANPYRILSGGLSPRGIEIVFEEYRKKLQIVLTPKSLRQACIFKWLSAGENENTIKEWMGVAPTYSLKLYKAHMEQYLYHDRFLTELYSNYLSKN